MVASGRQGTRAVGERQEETSQHVGKVNKVDGNAPGTQEATRTTARARRSRVYSYSAGGESDSDDIEVIEGGT